MQIGPPPCRTSPGLRPESAPLPGPGEAERLRRACEEFEGMVLGLLFREMQATVKRGGAIPSGTAGEIFHSLWGQAVAQQGARGGPLGVADLLMEALSGDRPAPGQGAIAMATERRGWGPEDSSSEGPHPTNRNGG